MGTDVYLEWDDMAEDFKNAQEKCAFNIDAGRLGYLRTSVGMKSENEFLKSIFASHWESDGEYKRFSFNQENFEKLKESLPDSKQNIRRHYGSTMLIQIDIGPKSNHPELEKQYIFYNSLIDFFELGMKKEKDGKNPKIYVSPGLSI